MFVVNQPVSCAELLARPTVIPPGRWAKAAHRPFGPLPMEVPIAAVWAAIIVAEGSARLRAVVGDEGTAIVATLPGPGGGAPAVLRLERREVVTADPVDQPVLAPVAVAAGLLLGGFAPHYAAAHRELLAALATPEIGEEALLTAATVAGLSLAGDLTSEAIDSLTGGSSFIPDAPLSSDGLAWYAGARAARGDLPEATASDGIDLDEILSDVTRFAAFETGRPDSWADLWAGGSEDSEIVPGLADESEQAFDYSPTNTPDAGNIAEALADNDGSAAIIEPDIPADIGDTDYYLANNSLETDNSAVFSDDKGVPAGDNPAEEPLYSPEPPVFRPDILPSFPPLSLVSPGSVGRRIVRRADEAPALPSEHVPASADDAGAESSPSEVTVAESPGATPTDEETGAVEAPSDDEPVGVLEPPEDEPPVPGEVDGVEATGDDEIPVPAAATEEPSVPFEPTEDEPSVLEAATEDEPSVPGEPTEDERPVLEATEDEPVALESVTADIAEPTAEAVADPVLEAAPSPGVSPPPPTGVVGPWLRDDETVGDPAATDRWWVELPPDDPMATWLRRIANPGHALVVRRTALPHRFRLEAVAISETVRKVVKPEPMVDGIPLREESPGLDPDVLDARSLEMPTAVPEDLMAGIAAVRERLVPALAELLETARSSREEPPTLAGEVPDRIVRVMSLRFALIGNGRWSLQQIGDLTGITKERVRQLEGLLIEDCGCGDSMHTRECRLSLLAPLRRRSLTLTHAPTLSPVADLRDHKSRELVKQVLHRRIAAGLAELDDAIYEAMLAAAGPRVAEATAWYDGYGWYFGWAISRGHFALMIAAGVDGADTVLAYGRLRAAMLAQLQASGNLNAVAALREWAWWSAGTWQGSEQAFVAALTWLAADEPTREAAAAALWKRQALDKEHLGAFERTLAARFSTPDEA